VQGAAKKEFIYRSVAIEKNLYFEFLKLLANNENFNLVINRFIANEILARKK
jgi:hypothetical protein